MSWYDKTVVAGRSKSLTIGNIRCGVAAIHEVPGGLALETPVNCHSELMEDSVQNIRDSAARSRADVSSGLEPRSNFPVLLTTQAEAFSKRCKLSVMVLGDRQYAM